MLPFPSPEKVPTRMYEGIARRVWTILAHCAERRQQGSLIHRSAWNRNFRKVRQEFIGNSSPVASVAESADLGGADVVQLQSLERCRS